MTQVEVLKSAVREILNKKFNNLKEVGWTFTGFNIIQYEKGKFEYCAFLLNFDIYFLIDRLCGTKGYQTRRPGDNRYRFPPRSDSRRRGAAGSVPAGGFRRSPQNHSPPPWVRLWGGDTPPVETHSCRIPAARDTTSRRFPAPE